MPGGFHTYLRPLAVQPLHNNSQFVYSFAAWTHPYAHGYHVDPDVLKSERVSVATTRHSLIPNTFTSEL